MKQQNNHTIHLNVLNTEEIIRTAACMADAILKPLYDYTSSRGLNGYIGALDIVCEWTKRFYQQYYSKMKDWDSFEESEDNVYNAVCWDDFVVDWTNEQFKKLKAENDHSPHVSTSNHQFYGSSKIPRLIIAIKNHTLSAVYSNTPVEIAHIDYDNREIADCPLVGIFEADTLALDLTTLFDTNDPQQQAIQEELISQGF